MPVIKSAIKKWRKDKKRTERNDEFRRKFQFAVRSVKRTDSLESLQEAFSMIDKAAKKHLIHANKAARMKSRLSIAAASDSKTEIVTKSLPAKTKPRSKAKPKTATA